MKVSIEKRQRPITSTNSKPPVYDLHIKCNGEEIEVDIIEKKFSETIIKLKTHINIDK